MYNYVYFMSNTNNKVLYIGVTSDLEKRVWEHKNSSDKRGFTYRYKCNKLVYYEVFGDIKYAIEREKQLKNWKRDWKNDLVSKDNPDWLDIDLGDCGSSPQ